MGRLPRMPYWITESMLEHAEMKILEVLADGRTYAVGDLVALIVSPENVNERRVLVIRYAVQRLKREGSVHAYWPSASQRSKEHVVAGTALRVRLAKPAYNPLTGEWGYR